MFKSICKLKLNWNDVIDRTPIYEQFAKPVSSEISDLFNLHSNHELY